MSTEEKDLLQEMNKVLESDIANRHSYFQMQYFIIGKEPTTQARMWQCLRELRSRRDSIRTLIIDIEEAKDQDRLLQIDLEKRLNDIKDRVGADPLDREAMEIECRRIGRKRVAVHHGINELEQKLQYAKEEAQFFLDLFVELNKETPLKPFDDLESQKEYWQERLAGEIHMRAVLNQPLDLELLKTTLALPDDEPIKRDVVVMLNKMTAQMVELHKQQEKGS